MSHAACAPVRAMHAHPLRALTGACTVLRAHVPAPGTYAAAARSDGSASAAASGRRAHWRGNPAGAPARCMRRLCVFCFVSSQWRSGTYALVCLSGARVRSRYAVCHMCLGPWGSVAPMRVANCNRPPPSLAGCTFGCLIHLTSRSLQSGGASAGGSARCCVHTGLSGQGTACLDVTT